MILVDTKGKKVDRVGKRGSPPYWLTSWYQMRIRSSLLNIIHEFGGMGV